MSSKPSGPASRQARMPSEPAGLASQHVMMSSQPESPIASQKQKQAAMPSQLKRLQQHVQQNVYKNFKRASELLGIGECNVSRKSYKKSK
ncbi:hypothetical protein M5689_002143 [Euphorbia peplus]|nr:hypothetical protein M5689_002143 [Euphorbia peplus]